jgi:hypothetical protein
LRKTGEHDDPPRREAVILRHPFKIRGIDGLLPAGPYLVIKDEEMIEGLSLVSFRRVATMIVVPAAGLRGSAVEMISIRDGCAFDRCKRAQ